MEVTAFPFADSALFEYYARALLHGSRLYVDLSDVKLPSIYYVDVLWQTLFGDRWLFHTIAEAGLNAVSAALFARLLALLRVPAWKLGTILFAAVFSLAFPQLNFPQHYAVFCILLSVVCALGGRALSAGAALLVATTFWLPGALTAIPLAFRLGRRARLAFSGGFIAAAVAYYAAFVPSLGPEWPAKPLSLWPWNVTVGAFRFAMLGETLWHTEVGLALLTLLCGCAVFFRRPENDAQRFGLGWLGVALIGALIPPRFYNSYFVPAIPAAAMTLTAFASRTVLASRRPLRLAGAALALGLLGRCVVVTVAQTATGFTDHPLPELFLAADAIPTSPRGLWSVGELRADARRPGYAVAPGWARMPDVLVSGALDQRGTPATLVEIENPARATVSTYDRVCPGWVGQFTLFATPQIAARFNC